MKVKLICMKLEQSPYCEEAIAVFAYFDGKPTKKQLEEVFDDGDTPLDEKCAVPDKISKLAGVKRYFVGQAV